ncbi:MAG TPA: formimidoylglutamase [Chryseobacterium sp.]|nr:formimidoylglutamase [Chryseobacterium sp.]
MNTWNGSIDGEGDVYAKLFQKVTVQKNYQNILRGSFVIHGFAVDEGVRRNNGRVGAKEAPDSIRKNMSGFPVVRQMLVLHDFGNISCNGNHLEKAQEKLADVVNKSLARGGKSIVLGGGHELMFAHYSGIQKAYPDKKIGIINIDAHFDNREMEEGVGATSGTGFWQIAQQGECHCLHIGIQKNSNTLKLFDIAAQSGMHYILADDIYFDNLPNMYQKIDTLSNAVDIMYCTICMDVFNAAIAPGVSAMAYNGIFADAAFMHLYRHILKNEKLMALDVAEVNPLYDEAKKTARLAASLVNEWLMI